MTIKKKIIKNFFVQHFLAFLSALYIKLVRATSVILEKNIESPEFYWKNNKPFILAFWHNQLMMISFCWKSNSRINILASGHSDGRFGAIVGKYFGLNNIPTSANDKSITLKPIFKLLKSSKCIGITPDGPRGPRMRAQMGVISLAQISGVPIFPATYSVSRCKIINSWDRFIIALPFNRGIYLWDEPIFVPKNANAEVLETKRKLLENRLNILCEKADKMVGLSSINPDLRHKIH